MITTPFQRPLVRATLTGCLLAAMTGCGSFDFAEGTVLTKRQVTEYHPNGQMKLQGWVGVNAQGNEVRTDEWNLWFDNGQPQWHGFYINDRVDDAQAWFEWNRSGSARDTWLDR